MNVCCKEIPRNMAQFGVKTKQIKRANNATLFIDSYRC